MPLEYHYLIVMAVIYIDITLQSINISLQRNNISLQTRIVDQKAICCHCYIVASISLYAFYIPVQFAKYMKESIQRSDAPPPTTLRVASMIRLVAYPSGHFLAACLAHVTESLGLRTGRT